MNDSLSHLVGSLHKNIDEIQEFWYSTFGSEFDKTWADKDKSLKKLVRITKKLMDRRGNRDGHASLFLRDPLSDRLNLVFSTNRSLNPGSKTIHGGYFSDKEANYDDQNRCCHYTLHDRLITDGIKNKKRYMKERGLTGWVALTGHPLRINRRIPTEILTEIACKDVTTRNKCQIYGSPTWGNRVSEFIADERDEWTQRLLAVPIKSVNDPEITIGVLRYSCLIDKPELTHLDVPVIEAMAKIAAAVIHLNRIKVVTTRDTALQLEKMKFARSGDFYSFLSFIAYAFRSEIVSLYISLDICRDEDKKQVRKRVLRLVDAYGISDFIEKLRYQEKIKDYDEETGGLTWELFRKEKSSPTIYETVLDTPNWRGINTAVFYEKQLERVGIENLSKLVEKSDHKPLLENYYIKIMGVGLFTKKKPVGVLKVEFPETYDASQHYDRVDESFFKKCADILAKELVRYQAFVNGNWFDNAGKEDSPEFIRLLLQIFRTRLVDKDDCGFWERVVDYSKKYESSLDKEFSSLLKKIPRTEKERWESTLQEIKKWLKEIAPKVLTEIFMKIISRHL